MVTVLHAFMSTLTKSSESNIRKWRQKSRISGVLFAMISFLSEWVFSCHIFITSIIDKHDEIPVTPHETGEIVSNKTKTKNVMLLVFQWKFFPVGYNADSGTAEEETAQLLQCCPLLLLCSIAWFPTHTLQTHCVCTTSHCRWWSTSTKSNMTANQRVLTRMLVAAHMHQMMDNSAELMCS